MEDFTRIRVSFDVAELKTAKGCRASVPHERSELVDYLVRTSRLAHSDAARLVDEVFAFLSEQPEEFVCRRHRESTIARERIETTKRMANSKSSPPRRNLSKCQ